MSITICECQHCTNTAEDNEFICKKCAKQMEKQFKTVPNEPEKDIDWAIEDGSGGWDV